jgi:hypothetical protein
MKTLSTPLRSASRPSFRAIIALAAVSAVVATALPAYASTPGPSNAARETLAKHEVTSLFAAAPLPPGSRQITAAAAETTAPFSGEKNSVYPANEVGAAKFYTAPSASAALTWLKSRRLQGHLPTSSGTTGSTRAQIYMLTGTTVLLQPQVVYIALLKPNGTLEFSVNASVWWRSQKPALAVVPPGATKLIVKLNRGVNAKTDRTASATTTNKSQIASIIAHINNLQAPSPLPTACPADFGAKLTMSFYRGGAKEPYSVVVADPAGCGQVTISQYTNAHVRTSASDVTGGVALSTFVATQVGIKDVSLS